MTPHDYETKLLPKRLRDLTMVAPLFAIDKTTLIHAAEAIELLAISHARYETLRLCDPRSFGELYAKNLAGRRFDDLVDELVASRVTAHQTPPLPPSSTQAATTEGTAPETSP